MRDLVICDTKCGDAGMECGGAGIIDKVLNREEIFQCMLILVSFRCREREMVEA